MGDNIEVSDLRVYELTQHYSNPMSIDELFTKNIKHLGLIQYPWEKEKGRRTQRKYCVEVEGDEVLAISHDYEYVLDGVEVLSYQRQLNYWGYNNEIIASKIVPSDTSLGKITELNRQIRISQVDGLREKAAGLIKDAETAPEPYKTAFITIANASNSILDHYLEVIERGYVFGFDEWITSMENETDPVMIQYLNTPVDIEGTTVKEEILNDIT